MAQSEMNLSGQALVRAESVTLNGSKIYYEVYGKGEPLFLLHGYTQSSKSWYPFIRFYQNNYELYLIDLKGHGNSEMFTDTLSISEAAEDVGNLCRHLKFENIKAIGFSYGGDILFQLCIQNPGLVESMIIIGACGNWHAPDFPEWVEYLSYNNLENLPWMREQQTSDEQIRAILEQVINYSVEVTPDQLKKISAKTLIIVGDQEDSITWDCILAAKNHMPECHLWVVPHTGHSAHRNENQENFVRISTDFLSGSW